MKSHTVMEGNAFYEIDEECVRRKQEERDRMRKEQKEAERPGSEQGRRKEES